MLDASPEIADILGAFGAYLDDAASQLNAAWTWALMALWYRR
ncbi:MAG: hypothetical protein R3A44_38920 [Caldilineaceae bacterium]